MYLVGGFIGCTSAVVVGGSGGKESSDTGPGWSLDDTSGDAPATSLVVELVDPAIGLTTGGEVARVLGGPLDEAGDTPVVTIGGAVAEVSGWTSTGVDLVTPPGEAGTVDVTLAQGGATGTGEGLFTYAEPCAGITRVEPDPVEGDLNHEETLTATLHGCATGLELVEPTRNSGELEGAIEVRESPESVDGTGVVRVWHYASPGYSGTLQWPLYFDTDQGRFTVMLELVGDGA